MGEDGEELVLLAVAFAEQKVGLLACQGVGEDLPHEAQPLDQFVGPVADTAKGSEPDGADENTPTFKGIITCDFNPIRSQYSRSRIASAGRSPGSSRNRSSLPW